jgi:hypothetical protein
MFTLTDVFDFLPHELAGLRRGRLTLTLVPACPFQRLFFRHGHSSSSCACKVQTIRITIGLERAVNRLYKVRR